MDDRSGAAGSFCLPYRTRRRAASVAANLGPWVPPISSLRSSSIFSWVISPGSLGQDRKPGWVRSQSGKDPPQVPSRVRRRHPIAGPVSVHRMTAEAERFRTRLRSVP